MLFSLKGVQVPHRKHTEDSIGERVSPPEKVVLPSSMHIGKPAKIICKVGDDVSVGTLIAEQDGVISSPIYATVSGKVTKLFPMTLANGVKAPAVEITSDGKMTPDPSLTPPTVTDRESLLEAIRKSGIVGLGGAGFPTYVKFNVEEGRVDTLVLNGAECEPYITSDTVTMVNRSDEIAEAIVAAQSYLGIRRVIIGIESNKKAAIASMQAMAAGLSNVEVKVLPTLYPQGGEKVLVYHTIGRVIPIGKLPLDVGCIVANVTTMATIGCYLRTGMPLVEKCITVDGGAVAQPQNITVPIGMSMADVFACCGGFSKEPAKVLYGGPMMGIAVNELSAPILKNTNAILALTEKEARLPKTTACIRCGACTNHCPFGLNPAALHRAYEKKDVEELKALSIDLCMECGCCSFICPANRPLVQTHKLSKALVRERKNKAKEANKQ